MVIGIPDETCYDGGKHGGEMIGSSSPCAYLALISESFSSLRTRVSVAISRAFLLLLQVVICSSPAMM